MAVFTQHSGATADPLVTALLSGASGISVLPGSVQLNASAPRAIGYYDGSLSALGIGPGIIMTSGLMPGTTNTSSSYGASNGKPGSPLIDSVINPVFYTTSYDASTLSFDFTVTDPTATSISFDLVFGSDEFPEWVDAYVDSAVVYVNGVNYAYFNHDPAHPLSIISQNLAAGYYVDNNGTGALPIEYDGISNKLTFVAPIIQGEVNTITIGISDTGDHILDSGVILSSLTAGDLPGSGVVITQPGDETEDNDLCVGSGLSEVFDLKGGDDTAYGAGGDDIISGGSGMDSLDGGSGDDALSGGADDDHLEGGAGDDTASYTDDSAAYDILYDASCDSYTITATTTGSTEGTDILSGIEKLQFADGLFQLDPGGLTPVPPDSGTGGGSGGGTGGNTPGAIALSGVAAEGQTLSATVSDVDGVPGTVTFIWQRSTDGGATWVTLAETTDSYTLTGVDAGADLRVLASYTDGLGAAEALTSPIKTVSGGATGDLQITLLQIEAPEGAAVASPLTTLVARAMELGLSPNEAQAMVKAVLALPGDANILQYDPLSDVLADTSDALAFEWLGTMLQVTILTSLSDDDTATGLVVGMIEAWQAGDVLDLTDADALGALLGILPDPDGNHPEPLAEILDRCASIANIVTDMEEFAKLENEWSDFASNQETVYVGTIAGLITPINQAPEGFAEGVLDGEAGTGVLIPLADLLAGYSDPEGGALSVTGLTADKPGTLLPVAGGWLFTPAEPGPVEFSYTVSDAEGLSISGAKVMIVTAAPTTNSPPTALNDMVSTIIDAAVEIMPLTNDSDPDAGDSLTLDGILSGPANGSVAIGAGGVITYTPLEHWFGTDSFTYSVSDSNGETATATATIDVAAPHPGWTTGPVRTDTAGTKPWDAWFEVFDDTGARVGKTTIYDDDRVLEQSFSGGVKVLQVSVDYANAYTWERTETTWDALTGDKITALTVHDDGRTNEETYVGGILASMVQTDVADVRAWATLERSWDPLTGNLLSSTTVRDNGIVMETLYVDGVRSSCVKTDPSDGVAWTEVTHSYDANGVIVARHQLDDNGQVIDTTYVNGTRAAMTLLDLGDAFVWERVDRNYDANGTLLQSEMLYDDGRTYEIDYADGVRSSALMTDVADIYAWESKAYSYDASGSLLDVVVTPDHVDIA